MAQKCEFGDFQTPIDLARRVVELVSRLGVVPTAIAEPTMGKGAFLRAAYDFWGPEVQLHGYEVNAAHVLEAQSSLIDTPAELRCCDFFEQDWAENLASLGADAPLVLGNPPWVTNADLGLVGSVNLPEKSNFVGLRGLDAKMGKSNFDISEWMIIRLLDELPSSGTLAMLCKTSTARKVLRHFWRSGSGFAGSKMFRIDAKAEFDVSVDACLFFVRGQRSNDRRAAFHESLDAASPAYEFGFVGSELVSNVDAFQKYSELDGQDAEYVWRSGVKHDASKIMEFSLVDGAAVNGLGETADIEDEFLFPLLKSSDLGNGRVDARKAVLVTQSRVGEDTSRIESCAPKTWDYLTKHGRQLGKR